MATTYSWFEHDEVEEEQNDRVRRDQKPANDLRLKWALEAASLGIRVISIAKGGQKPLIKDYFDKASVDEKTIVCWFEREFPGCNFGLIMGEDWCVLDIDAHTEAEDGRRSLAEIFSGAIETFTVETPRGGLHYYFRTNGADFSKMKLAPGIDFLGAKSFCVAPYSVREDFGPYRPRNSFANTIAIPPWLVERIRKKPEGPGSRVGDRGLDRRALTKRERLNLGRLLGRIDPSLHRDDWRDAIYAAFNIWGSTQDVRDYLEEWSKRSAKWDQAAFDKIVESFDASHRTKVALPTLRRLWSEYPQKQPHPILVEDEDVPHIDRQIGVVLEIAIGMLQRNGNDPSASHEGALEDLAGAMVAGLYSNATFRKAYPLGTGMGKTTVCAALCRMIEAEKSEKSVAIFVETIAQGEEFRQMATAAGVSPEAIGLLHNNPAYLTSVPPIKVGDSGKYPFLVACHARAKTHTKYNLVDVLLSYKGKKRDLVIWDESMISSNGFQENKAGVLMAARVWLETTAMLAQEGRRSLKHEGVYKEFTAYLEEAIRQLQDMQDGIIELPFLPADLSVYRSIISSVLEQMPLPAVNGEEVAQTLHKLTEFSARGQIRIVPGGNGNALVQFEQSIDPKFEKVIILDASAPIRDLVDYDETIEVVPCKVQKDYSDVTFRVVDVLSSKSSFAGNTQHLKNYLSEVEYLIGKVIPSVDDVLVFCHKELETMVKEHLEPLQEQRHGRVHVLHWGEHRAVNRYASCKWLITVGVVYLPAPAVASMIIGQTGNLNYGLSDSEVRSVILSEQAEMLYQAVSRGHSRNTVRGKAAAQTIFLFHPKRDWEPVRVLLEEVMPNVKVEEHASVFLHRDYKNTTRSFEVASQIKAHLDRMTDKDSISVRRLIKHLGVESNQRPWREGLNIALEETVAWRKEGAKLVRVPRPERP